MSVSVALAGLSGIASSAGFAQGLVVEEVIVTAQKREQSLQEVPVAVTAIGAEEMKASGIDDIADLNTANPSFIVNVQQNKVSNSPARIRGIGTTGTNPAFEGAVGMYVDGVYRSRSGMVLSTFNDIGQLQILRGPQGTLFGKNTSAGALILDSVRPTAEFEAGIDVSAGNYDSQKYTAFVNGSLSDSVVGRIAVLHNKRDGFFDNPLTGANTTNIDTQSVKGQLLWRGDTASVRFIADYTQADELCCYNFSGRLDPEGDIAAAFAAIASPDPSDDAAALELVYQGFAAAAGVPWYDQTGDVFARNNVNQTDSTDESEDWGVSINASIDLTDDIVLQSITSYREYTNEQTNADWDFSPVDFGADYRQFYEFQTLSQEFNLNGLASIAQRDVEYVLGAFYSNEDLDHTLEQGVGEDLGDNWQIAFAGTPLEPLTGDPDQLARPGTLFANTNFDHSDEVIALYGHFTFSVTDTLNLIAGVRYSREEKELDRTNLFGGPLATLNHIAANQLGALGLGASFSGPDLKTSIEEKEWTYTAGFQWFPSDATQVYASYSRGYKAGGISLNADAGGNLVSILNLFGPPPTTDDAVITGPAVDPTYEPEFVDSYEVGLKTEYQDGRGRLNLAGFLSDFEDIQANTFTGTAFLTYNADTATTRGIEIENTYALIEGLTSTASVTWLADASFGNEPNAFQPLLPGRDIELAPEWAGFLGLRYDRNVSADVNVYGNLNVSYTGDHNLSNDVDAEASYTTWGAAVGVRLMNERLDVQINCSNCTDEEYLTNAFTAPLQFHGPLMGNAGPPRVYALNVSYRWY